METETVRIDFEVYKALTLRRSSAEVSYNDVLRELLGLSTRKASRLPSGRPWTAKGVTFPEGTELRGTYKGVVYTAVVKDGSLEYRGEQFTTPSRAAMAITKTQTDGWKFWECRRPGDASWRRMKTLRTA